jgi:hypothetical protein
LAKQKTAGVEALETGEHKLESFAEDLGRMLGSARAKADSWLGQRAEIVKALEGVRETASNLLRQLGQVSTSAGRNLAGQRRAAGRPKGSGRKRRRLSPEARERIAAAQRARWARVTAAKKR